ncbi:hypothetical protein JVU11DRAFT_8187 [Chiua virens]|nr:hypothetical protein JVU11DRAFT_8187 [Chiua virens]
MELGDHVPPIPPSLTRIHRMNPSTESSPSDSNRRPATCRLYAQGRCRFGDKCWFSHATDVQPTLLEPTSANTPSSPTSRQSSDARPRPKRGEIPCRAWKAGTCTKGSKCWFGHDIESKPAPDSVKPYKQNTSTTARALPVEEGHSTSDLRHAERRAQLEAERARARGADVAAARERANAVTREEAAKTITQVVFGSIVTFSAGLDVRNLVTGFETCTLRVGPLPLDVKEDDIHALILGFQDSGATDHFHFVIKRRPDRRLEAHIVTGVATGRALALELDGVEFREETLGVETSATNSLEGMNAENVQSSEILTISWRAPSVRYVAEYVDIAVANDKVKELDRVIYGGRRVKVEMNAQPRGRYVRNLSLNAIKINNLPPSVTDEDVKNFANSTSVKRLPIGGVSYTVGEIARLVREDIERAVPGGLKKFDDPPGTCTMEGVVAARAHFSSWDEAHTTHTHLSDKRYGNQPVWLRLPDPMHFTLVIPVEQYKAQKEQWDSLLDSIKDRKACTLHIRDSGNIMRIRLSGSVKEATGALKVRVENLARGDKVEGWHRSFGFPGNPFVSHIHSATGAYLRADSKRQSLNVYGAPRAVDRAREMVKSELERLASLDYTVTLARNSVGFFVREGIQQLKEIIGENNVKFTMSSRKITVSGGEEARHALDRLITLSHKGNQGVGSAAQGSETCPICYDTVSSAHQLGCGHTYCVACLRHFISSALESDQLPLTCLGDETQCRVPIPIPTIQQFLPPATFNRLLEAAFDTYIAKHPEEYKHCKTPDCTQIYRSVVVGRVPQTRHCPSCFSAVCNGCHEEAHDGLSCAEGKARRDPEEQERLNDAWIASQGGRVKKCPQCHVPIEKLEGCNHISCRCGAHICWRCMGIFTQETIYPHMHRAHQTIHDDALAAQERPGDIGIPVDIEEQLELFRQVGERRIAGLQRANGARPVRWQPEDAHDGLGFNMVHEIRELDRERFRRIEEQNRMIREQRLRREAEEERREAQARQNAGWGCAIM